MLVAILVELAVALAFALAARDRIRADGPTAAPAFPLVAAHAGVVTAPIALYFYVVQPAWTWHYLVDPASVPALAVVPLVVGHALVVIGGWYAGAWLVRADRGRLHLYLVFGLGLIAVTAIALLFPRLTAASSYRDYQAGIIGRPMSVELGWAVLVATAATVAAAAYVGFELARDGRRVRAR